jgi:HNH endonuclease/NUMOD4 motif
MPRCDIAPKPSPQSPERWLPVVGYEKLYAVSTHGRVVSKRKDQLLRPRARNNRRPSEQYPVVKLCVDGVQKEHPVHKLVLTAFRGSRRFWQVCRHLDRNVANNNLSNLTWEREEIEPDPAGELWKPVAGYELHYIVSNAGRVFSVQNNKFLTSRFNNKKYPSYCYPTVELSRGGVKKKFKVHRLVLTTFRGARPEGKECRHLDGNPSNNSLSNLEWGTPQENQDDRRKHRKKIKLTPELVRYIRNSTKTLRALATEIWLQQIDLNVCPAATDLGARYISHKTFCG